MDNFDIQEAPKEQKIHMEIEDEKVQFEEEEGQEGQAVEAWEGDQEEEGYGGR